MLNNLSMFGSRQTVKPLSEFEMYKLYWSMAGRDFDINNMPVEMRVFTDKGIHSYPAGSVYVRFEKEL